MRLIDVDALISSLGWLSESGAIGNKTKAIIKLAIQTADAQPTIDAVKVIKCKDCRFFEDEDYYGNCYCEEWGNITNANGYCHDAERRKDADT